jgi:hypothetical protein
MGLTDCCRVKITLFTQPATFLNEIDDFQSDVGGSVLKPAQQQSRFYPCLHQFRVQLRTVQL